MIGSILLWGAAAAAPVAPLPDAVKRDVQCFILYAIGVDSAQEEAKKQGASLGLMYFFAKLKMEAPAIDLVEAVRQEANAIGKDPLLKETGSSCDSEFQQRGKELMDLGQRLQGALAPVSTT